ncbi:Cytosolic iron-sulfur protein assembly protein [Scheffersomyces spartinae]|uniref:Probable cytosolic iron-sulfur protein assembly protein 1 n=1 Tax=Scheffersomyces spartinae TaxID=45513 RepID=A0A9P8AI88_9ASCO|nr:Cytosolic iron-sulfur protein assembly protein [Scheffersomyces spartinae]KAG7193485.1 Cytosolic iron-sulfur protein assembly protein [Scheffersomyces spartinae]
MNLIASIAAHKDKCWSVASHQSLPLLATSSTDKTSKIYKLLAKQHFPQVAVLEDAHKRSIRSVAFQPPVNGLQTGEPVDLPVVANGSFDLNISVWGIDEPEELDELESDKLDDSDDSNVQAVKDILCSSNNEWMLMALIEGHENEVKAVAWNHTGQYLASCSRDKTVWIWETDPQTLDEFECVAVFNDHDQDVKHVSWCDNRNMLALSSYDDTIRVYVKEDGEDDWDCATILNGHTGTVWCSQFEPSQRSDTDKIRLVSCSDDLSVRIWSSSAAGSSSSAPATAATAERLPSSIKHTHDDQIWELETILPAVHQYSIYSVAWSPYSGRIVSSGADGKIVVYKQDSSDDRQWTIEQVKENGHGINEINCVTWSILDDGTTEVIVSAGDDGMVNIWNSS